MAYTNGGFPAQQLPFQQKNKAWRKRCVDFGDDRSLLKHPQTRKSVAEMRVNYDLVDMKLHMDDLQHYLNPYNLDASYIPDSIQHYPIINSKLRVLRGEESSRTFDFRAVVTNPTAITEMEESKKQELLGRLSSLMGEEGQGEEEFNRRLESLGEYFTYEWQDMRETRANQLLNHYMKELELPQLFNKGFEDALICGEEIYQCDIVGGEPVVERLDPMKVRVLKSGSSDRIEDADMVIVEDYWSPGRVMDTFWDVLSKKDVESLENPSHGLGAGYVDSMANVDPRYGFIPNVTLDEDSFINPLELFTTENSGSLLPWDADGNVRVLRVYWKSRRKIKKVKSYDPETGEERFSFYPETYVIDRNDGEEEQSFWINEAWEGTKIGKDIYVNMRPRPVQYNRLSNPSRCHFGIVGSIYGVNGGSPVSMVDIMKPYNYLYDIVHDRLNKLLAGDLGKAVRLDLAKVPKKWDVDKWLYFLKTNHIAVEDSFNEGDIGAASGKLAGAMNNATNGVIDASLSGDIQYHISLLEVIDQHMGRVAGVSEQREGQISNRETVGGVERAVLQSSHITEWLFFTHDSVKRRVLECLIETAKIALRGRSKKFSYILSDGSERMADIDGDEFAECDYGIVVDNSNGVRELSQKLDILAQAALQNQLLDFSSIMRLYTTGSMAEKQRMVEANERRVREQQQQQQQQQLQIQQEQLRQQAEAEERKRQLEYQMHKEDNETKLLVAQINSQAEAQRFAMMQDDSSITAEQQYELQQRELEEKARQFDQKMRKEDEKLALERKKHSDEVAVRGKLTGK